MERQTKTYTSIAAAFEHRDSITDKDIILIKYAETHPPMICNKEKMINLYLAFKYMDDKQREMWYGDTN